MGPAREAEAPAEPPQAPGRPGTGGYPIPPRGRRPARNAPAPAPEPHTEQFPAVDQDATDEAFAGQNAAEQTALAEPVSPNEAPAGLTRWDGGDDPAAEDTRIAAPVGFGGRADPADTGGPSTGYYVPDFDDDDYDDYDGSGYGAGDFGGDEGYGDGRYGDGRYGDGRYGDERYGDEWYGDERYGDDYDSRTRTGLLDDDPLEDERDGEDADESATRGEADDRRARTTADSDTEDTEDEDEDEDASPVQQWLVLAGQLALGVAGGAGVWLAFNWLWGQMPAAALIAAVLVTVALVWVVRKVRRAEDTQTTVLAMLVGLVVTVSPAALLLVSR